MIREIQHIEMVRPSLRERQKTKYTVDPIGDHDMGSNAPSERDSNRSEDGEGEGEYEESYSPGAGESPPSSPDGDSDLPHDSRAVRGEESQNGIAK